MSDTQLRQLITAHIDEDEFCRYVIQRDINGIALALRETHKDDFFSVPEDNPLKECWKLLVKSSARTATRNKRTWRLSANGSS